MRESETADLKRRESYRFWSEVTTRFADIDELGHLNNLAAAIYCETGRVEFRESIYRRHETALGVGFLVVRTTVDYHAQAHYPGVVEVGTAVTRIGRTSYTLGQGCFKDGICFATGETVTVYANLGEHRSLALPDALRSGLEAYALSPSSVTT
jgi:acyl-CoA thioester hydrolase